MKQNFYTSDISMIASGIILSLIGVIEHQIAWIIFGIPVSIIYIASWLYSQKKGHSNRRFFDAILMILAIIAVIVLMIFMIKEQKNEMVILCAFFILAIGYSLYKIIKSK